MRAEAASLIVELVGAMAGDEVAAIERDRSPAVRAALAGALINHPFVGSEKLLERLNRDPVKAVQAAAAAEKEHEQSAPSAFSPTASTSLGDLDRTKDEVEWLSIVDAALRRAPRETVKKQQP